MLSSLPSILDNTSPPALDGAVARAAREAHTGFATLMQQQADLRGAMMRNIDRQAAVHGRPAQAQPKTHTHTPEAAGTGNTHAAPHNTASALQAKSAEPPPRKAQHSDRITDGRASDASPESPTSEASRAEAGATDRADRKARPATTTPAARDAATEPPAAPGKPTAAPGETTAALAQRNRLSARARAGATAAAGQPGNGVGRGPASAAAGGFDTRAADGAPARGPKASTASNAASPDASQMPAWLQGQALVTGWRPAPPAAGAALTPAIAANAPGLATGPVAGLPGSADATASALATSLAVGQPPLIDAARTVAATPDAETRTAVPLDAALQRAAGTQDQAAGARVYGLAAGGPATPAAGKVDAATERNAAAAQAHHRAVRATEVAEPARAAPAAPSAQATPSLDTDPAADGVARMAVATAAALASDTSPALPAPAGSAASLSPGAIGHTGNAVTQASPRDDGNGRSPITAAPTVITPATTSAPSTASTNRPAAPEPGNAAGANLLAQGAAGTTASARAAAMSPGFASVAASARATAGAHTGVQGDGAATARTAGTPTANPADDTVRSARRGSGLPPAIDRTPASEAAAGADRLRAAFGQRTDTEQTTLALEPDVRRDPNGSARPSTGAGTPSAAAGPGPALTPASLAALAAQAAQAVHATLAENRPGTAAAERVGAAEPGASSLMAPAPISGSAPATAVTTNASAGSAPAGVESRIPVPLDSPAFAPALGAQISLFALDGVQTARLQLNPAEMGPITVQIALDGSAARVDFQADLASTREVIEASLPALAGALQEAGMTLAGGGVSQQPSSHQPPAQAEHPSASRRAGDRALDADAPPRPTSVPTRTRGLVDLVA